MSGAHYDGVAVPKPANGEGAPKSPRRPHRRHGWAAQRPGATILLLACTLRIIRAALTLSHRIGRAYQPAPPCLGGFDTQGQEPGEAEGVWTGGLLPLPPVRSAPGGASTLPADNPTTPILERARKLAGLWVVEDNGQDAYLAWMDFCQDWARHRLKQFYFERHDDQLEPPRERTNPCCTAQWTWEHGMRAPPYRTTSELDRMANDICEEAWDQGRDVRGHLVALVRALQQRGLLPRWFYQVVAG